MDPSLSECSPFQVEDVMELLDICLKTMYFQFEDKFYQQKEGMAMGNYLWWSVTYSWSILRKQLWTQQTTNLLNGSDTSTTLSWYGHIDQQGYSNFSTISMLGLQSNSLWKLMLIIPLHSWTFWL
jgi:hypothetical protein